MSNTLKNMMKSVDKKVIDRMEGISKTSEDMKDKVIKKHLALGRKNTNESQIMVPNYIPEVRHKPNLMKIESNADLEKSCLPYEAHQMKNS
jgi:hypothetical protein